MTRTHNVAALVMIALAAVGAPAQTTLPDLTALVATPSGLYVVPPGAAGTMNTEKFRFRVAVPADFDYDGVLPNPELAWIRNTDTVLVTTTNGGSAPGGLFRARLGSDGALLSVERLATGAFRDVDTSAARDEAWVLDGAAGHVLRLQAPDVAPPQALELVNATLPPGEGRALAVVGNDHPFGLWVRGNTHIWRVPSHSGPAASPYLTSGVTRVGSDPLDDPLYLMMPTVSVVGRAVYNIDTGSLAAVDVNLHPSGDCKPALGPFDFVLDGTELLPEQGIVVVTGAVGWCMAGGQASGSGHLLWLPRHWLADNGNPPPRLLTPLPVSGVSGSRGSLDLVRTAGSELAHVGYPQPTADGGHKPRLRIYKYGELQVTLTAAPPDTAVLLSLRVAAPHAVIEPFPPLARHAGRNVPLVTDGRGEVSVSYPVPGDPALTGVRVVVQALTADAAAAPGEPPFVPTQKIVFVVGTL